MDLFFNGQIISLDVDKVTSLRNDAVFVYFLYLLSGINGLSSVEILLELGLLALLSLMKASKDVVLREDGCSSRGSSRSQSSVWFTSIFGWVRSSDRGGSSG